MFTFHLVVTIANAVRISCTYSPVAMNALDKRRIMISEYLLTLVYNILKHVSKIANGMFIQVYRYICTEQDALQGKSE